jgi:hypothetical protein
MSYVKYTKTSTFLFPLLDISKSLFKCDIKKNDKQIMTTRFLNAFLNDKDLNNTLYNDGPFVFIVIKPYQDIDFDKFHSDLIVLDNYVDEYIKNNYLVMLFKIKDKYMKDYELILKGKYSKVSKAGKKIINNNSYFSGQSHIVPLILRKAEELKESWQRRLTADNKIIDLGDQEVWGILDMEKENLTKEIIMEYSYSKISTVAIKL